MDIDKLSVILMRDFKKEFFDLPSTIYLNFSPVMQPGTSRYKTIQPSKKDPLCFIKHRDRDLWVYEENNKLVMKPIQRDHKSFGVFEPPTIFWLEYLNEPSFLMYKPKGTGIPEVYYLSYYEDEFNGIQMKWTKDFHKATRFIYKQIEWKQKLTSNMFAKVINEYD